MSEGRSRGQLARAADEPAQQERGGGGAGEQERPHRLGAAEAWPGLRGELRDRGMNTGFPQRCSPAVIEGPPASGTVENPSE